MKTPEIVTNINTFLTFLKTIKSLSLPLHRYVSMLRMINLSQTEDKSFVFLLSSLLTFEANLKIRRGSFFTSFSLIRM